MITKTAPKTPGAEYVDEVMSETKERNPGEPEFHQAVVEVLDSLIPVFDRRPDTGRRASWSGWSSRSG